MKLILFTVAVLSLQTLNGCKTKQINTGTTNAGTPTVVYKTKADYSKYVPVTLSADKKEITAYPSPKDIYYLGKLAYPTPLANGYLLDNRGISPNSAFLKITFNEYSKLNTAPSLVEMYNQILEKDPFTEIYNLGNRERFKNEIKEINRIIKKGDLKKFTVIKKM